MSHGQAIAEVYDLRRLVRYLQREHDIEHGLVEEMGGKQLGDCFARAMDGP